MQDEVDNITSEVIKHKTLFGPINPPSKRVAADTHTTTA